MRCQLLSEAGHLATGILGFAFWFLAAFWVLRSKHAVLLFWVAFMLGALLVVGFRSSAAGSANAEPLSFAAGLLLALGIWGLAANGVLAIVSRSR
jgi:hypothetical protein